MKSTPFLLFRNPAQLAKMLFVCCLLFKNIDRHPVSRPIEQVVAGRYGGRGVRRPPLVRWLDDRCHNKVQVKNVNGVRGEELIRERLILLPKLMLLLSQVSGVRSTP